MNFQQCLEYLEEVQKLGVKFGLDNVRTVLESLHQPHVRYPTILVAGTNGKGSVSAMITRILSLHGFRVGLYTSPHLVSVRERIRIGDTLISKKAFSLRLTFLKENIEALIHAKKLQHHPTYFEILSCLAFLSFKRDKVDFAVLEVGMGGRFDATNVVSPLVSVITTISPEHQKALGETSGQIAFEKSGIMRPGVPVVCGTEDPEALDVLQRRAEEL
jgi:dihydrofolate synthase/folylpolyglutamate synthase